jgi:hypothetical protein
MPDTVRTKNIFVKPIFLLIRLGYVRTIIPVNKLSKSSPQFGSVSPGPKADNLCDEPSRDGNRAFLGEPPRYCCLGGEIPLAKVEWPY